MLTANVTLQSKHTVPCDMFACVLSSVGNDLTGNTNLITHYNLEHAYNKFCGKKVKEKLSNFLPELPGNYVSFLITNYVCQIKSYFSLFVIHESLY